MKEEFRRKLGRELKKVLSVFLFLALFFSAFATYRALFLDHVDLPLTRIGAGDAVFLSD
jgi:hypothetical protein